MILYQTLKDKGNPEEIETKGPFDSKNKAAWLGEGYYFWDSHIELGHWWGRTVHGKDNYIICSCEVTQDETCWDLHGDGGCRIEFEKICTEMIKERLTTRDKLTVPRVISFMKLKNIFNYKAIRALGMNSVGGRLADPFLLFRVKFIKSNNAYLDLHPPVQVCLLTKRALSLCRYLVVYPDIYVEQAYA